jgi:hypothetical protein
MFMMANAHSEATSRSTRALPTSLSGDSGPSSSSGFCTRSATGTASRPAMPTAMPNGPAMVTPATRHTTAPVTRMKPSAPR